MSFLKITPELIAAVGAKTEEEFPAAFIAKLAELGTPKADTALAATVTALSGKVTTIETTLASLPKPITEARITEIAVAAVPADIIAKAKAAGKEGAASSLANTGSRQPANMSAADQDEGGKKQTFAEVVKALVAAGKSKTQAIVEGMKTAPAAYAEYQKTGGQLWN